MKEIIIYTLAAISSLTILGYSVHMFIGGLVSPETERNAIIAACLIGFGVIAFLVKDVINQRRK